MLSHYGVFTQTDEEPECERAKPNLRDKQLPPGFEEEMQRAMRDTKRFEVEERRCDQSFRIERVSVFFSLGQN